MSFFEVDPYKITTNQFDKTKMRYIESITALSNGFIGLRGNFEENYSGDKLSGTYIAGVWYPDKTRVGWWKNGYPEYFGKAINTVNFIGIKAYINDEELDLSGQQVICFLLELDMKTATLKRRVVINTESGCVQIQSERFLSFSQKNICAIRYKITPIENNAEIKLIPYLDFNVTNEDANYGEDFWDNKQQTAHGRGGYVEAQTKQNPYNNNRFKVGAAMYVNTINRAESKEQSCSSGWAEQKILFNTGKGECVEIEKIISVHSTDTDANIKQSAISSASLNAVKGFEKLKAQHISVFSKLMQDCDVEIEGDDSAQQGIRYNLFQLLSTHSGDNPKLNIGPKGMTGEKYGGAAYWDTEAFLVPFYLGVRSNDVAKNLLLFRYNTLQEAVENAKKLGLKGAHYPMVTFDGHECHNEWEITFEEIHRNGAIAYAIYNYVTYTGDTDYVIDYGFDVLIEIARFFVSRVHYHQEKAVYMIHGVTGPNEYENNVNNNWYTNYIAKWCLEYTAEIAQQHRHQLDNKFSDNEIADFKKIAARMYLPSDSSKNIAVQHDTFLDKELKSAGDIDEHDRPLHRHWSWDRILRSCYIKQADVVQGLYMFGHQMNKDFIRSNFEFYEPMTVHESSLSASIHSVVASRLGDKQKAYELYKWTARLDLDDINSDTSDGQHITSMSGAWIAITAGFAGMTTITGEIKFTPYLPAQLTGYAFKIHYRKRLIKVKVNQSGVSIAKISGDNLVITVYGTKHMLSTCVKLPLRESHD